MFPFAATAGCLSLLSVLNPSLAVTLPSASCSLLTAASSSSPVFRISPIATFVLSEGASSAGWLDIVFGAQFSLIFVCCSTVMTLYGLSEAGIDFWFFSFSVFFVLFISTASVGLSKMLPFSFRSPAFSVRVFRHCLLPAVLRYSSSRFYRSATLILCFPLVCEPHQRLVYHWSGPMVRQAALLTRRIPRRLRSPFVSVDEPIWWRRTSLKRRNVLKKEFSLRGWQR